MRPCGSENDGDVLAFRGEACAPPVADGADGAYQLGFLKRTATILAAPDRGLMMVIEARSVTLFRCRYCCRPRSRVRRRLTVTVAAACRSGWSARSPRTLEIMLRRNLDATPEDVRRAEERRRGPDHDLLDYSDDEILHMLFGVKL
jgi:hypothetical protein